MMGRGVVWDRRMVGGRGMVGRLRAFVPEVTGGVGLLRAAAPRPRPFLVALVVGGSGGGGWGGGPPGPPGAPCIMGPLAMGPPYMGLGPPPDAILGFMPGR